MKLRWKVFSTSTFAFLNLFSILRQEQNKLDLLTPLHKNHQWFSITLKSKSLLWPSALLHSIPSMTMPQPSQSSVWSLTCQAHFHPQSLCFCLGHAPPRFSHGGFLLSFRPGQLPTSTKRLSLIDWSTILLAHIILFFTSLMVFILLRWPCLFLLTQVSSMKIAFLFTPILLGWE